MHLKQFVISHFGPFTEGFSIDIDPEVTILTGRNDVGKSLLLKALQLLYLKQRAEEDHINLTRKFYSGVEWNKDLNVYCIAKFEIDDTRDSQYIRQAVQLGWKVDIHYRYFTGLISVEEVMSQDNRRQRVENKTVNHLPTLLSIQNDDLIRNRIEAENPTQLEDKILLLAFGENYVTTFKSHNETLKTQALRNGVKRLNRHLKLLLPETINLELHLTTDSREDEPLVFHLSFIDETDSETPITYRGSGVRKILSLLANLALIVDSNEPMLILIDEPENSLHADAQHLLRRLLENLGKRKNIQVIYATHSPSMINNFKVRGLRLLTRITENDLTKTIVETNPIAQNFFKIRTNLGITPSDSLLYSTITIITEGETESVALNLFLSHYGEREAESDEIIQILSLLHIVSADGSGKIPYFCELVRSHGSFPVVFVDGDKAGNEASRKVKRKYNDIPVISMPPNSEFEELIDKEIYFSALSSIANQVISFEEFTSWTQANVSKNGDMFSKRVDEFMKSKGLVYKKPQTMIYALENIDVTKINFEPIEQLVEEIKELITKKGIIS